MIFVNFSKLTILRLFPWLPHSCTLIPRRVELLSSNHLSQSQWVHDPILSSSSIVNQHNPFLKVYACLYSWLFFLVEVFLMLHILELIFLLQTYRPLFVLYIKHMTMVDVLQKVSLYFMIKSLVRLILKFLQYLLASDKIFIFALVSPSNVACNKKVKIRNDTNILQIVLKQLIVLPKKFIISKFSSPQELVPNDQYWLVHTFVPNFPLCLLGEFFPDLMLVPTDYI